MATNLFISLCLTLLVSFSCSKKESDPNGTDPIDEKGVFRNLGPQLTKTDPTASAFVLTPEGKTIIYTVVKNEIGRLVGVDIETKEVVVNLPLEGTDTAWGLEVSTDGWLYIGGNGSNFFSHLPGSQIVTNLGQALPKETIIWDLVAGKDGEIFGGTYPGGKVFRYHPDDGFSDVGNGSLVSNENYTRSIAYHAESDMIYAGIGSHAHLVELNPRTGQKREFLPPEYKSNEFITYLSIIKDEEKGDKLLAYLTPKTLIYNLRTKQFEGEVGVEGILVGSAIKSPTKEEAYFTAGGRVYSWNLTNNKTVQVDHSTTNALATGWNKDGKLNIFNTRAELIQLDLEKKTNENLNLSIPALPLHLWYVGIGPGNKIWTGGNGHAAYDLSTNTLQSFSGLSEAKSMTSIGSNVYLGIYPGGKLYWYDSNKAWNVNSQNPKLLSQISGQDRLFGMISVPELNRIYVGTVPDYGKNGGALVEVDISTNKISTYTNVIQNQSIIRLVYSGGLLFGGSSNRGGYGIEPSEREAKLFIWDPIAKKKISEIIPVKNGREISALAEGPDKRIWGMASGTLFIYDRDKNAVTTTKEIVRSTSSIGGWEPGALIFHPNGYLYGMDKKTFFKIDIETMKIEILDRSAANLVMDNKNVLYYSKGSDLWEYTP